MINATPIGGEETRHDGWLDQWRRFLTVEPSPPLGELRHGQTERFANHAAIPDDEMHENVAREAARLLREEYERSRAAAQGACAHEPEEKLSATICAKCRVVLAERPRAVASASPRVVALDEIHRRRETLVEYARDQLDAEDWHGLSDAANDLRELDVEIRMTEATDKGHAPTG